MDPTFHKEVQMMFIHRLTYVAVLTCCLLLSSLAVFAQETFMGKTDDEGGWLGVSIQDLTTALKEAMDYERDVGVLVNDVEEDSPAEEAGIQEGDVIIEYDGKAISNTGSLIRKVRATDPGDEVRIVVIRKGRETAVSATIDEKPRGYRYWFGHTGKGEPHIVKVEEKTGWLGVHLQDLTEQLGEYFGVPDGEGALVTEVIENSPAEKAGLHAGDVIVSFDGDDIDDVDELIETVRNTEVGEDVEIELMRDRKKRTIRAEIGKAPKKYKRPMIDIFGLPGCEGQYDIRCFDNFRKQLEHFEDEEPLWRHRIHEDFEEGEIRELKKRIRKLEGEIEKLREKL